LSVFAEVRDRLPHIYDAPCPLADYRLPERATGTRSATGTHRIVGDRHPLRPRCHLPNPRRKIIRFRRPPPTNSQTRRQTKSKQPAHLQGYRPTHLPFNPPHSSTALVVAPRHSSVSSSSNPQRMVYNVTYPR